MFKSFFMAGFECATGRNVGGEWIDQVVATQHDRQVRQDYRRVADLGLLTIREGVRWPSIDRKGKYRYESLKPFVEASQEMGLEVLWDLFHYGYPEDLDPFAPEFVRRFEDYCHGVASYLRLSGIDRPWLTPINEPSYYAWAAGDACKFAPHACGRSFELKTNLIRAAIAGIEGIWAACPKARIINVDPLCRVAAPLDRPDLKDEAEAFNEDAVFQSFDMLAGRRFPEMGGSPRHLGIVGVNYYWTNQWEHTRPGLPLAQDDARKWPLRDLIRWVWHRYSAEIVLTETAHVGEHRATWMAELADEVEAILDEGIPLRGVCLYPILGMPEWHDRHHWTRMGVWDLHEQPDGTLERVPHEPLIEELRKAQSRFEDLELPKPAVGRK